MILEPMKTSNLKITVLLVSLLLGVLWVFTKKAEKPSSTPSPAPAVTQPGGSPTPLSTSTVDLTPDAQGLSKATVTITTARGIIRFKFYPKDAPNTVNRMVELVRKGFYNGLKFHRVESWVIQGGDPTGSGSGGSGQRLKAEFNNRIHKEGSVGMARALDPDSADSQFYIVFGPQPHLDGSYTVFGQVIEGMDVVRKIQRGDAMSSLAIQ